MKETIKAVAELMAISARTAPKGRGEDSLEILVVSREEKERIADEMFKIGNERGDKLYQRDGENVRIADALVLIGLKEHSALNVDCMACGFVNCNAFNNADDVVGDAIGPNCINKVVDLGIALGSAVKTASIHNVDTRIMYRAGVAARRAGITNTRVTFGIPLSVTGKNIFFDRRD